MDELLKMLKDKLELMKKEKTPVVAIEYHELAQIYQVICLMKQIKDIAEWSDNWYV